MSLGLVVVLVAGALVLELNLDIAVIHSLLMAALFGVVCGLVSVFVASLSFCW